MESLKEIDEFPDIYAPPKTKSNLIIQIDP